MILEATAGIRFVVRGGSTRVLQQAWRNRGTGEIEWRDVPLAGKCKECDGEGKTKHKGTMGVYVIRCSDCDGSGYK